MNIEKETLEQLKKSHPGGIYEGSITFEDEEHNQREVCFIHRKPTTADIEAHSKTAQRSPLVANLNIIAGLIIYPEPGPVIDAIREYPAAYSRFVDEGISHFFGGNVSIKTRKL